MSLLQKLKSALGFDGQSAGTGSASTGDVDVTVEREPSTSSEDAVKGTDTGDGADRTDTADEPTTSGDGSDASGAEPAADTADTADASVDEIKGIGQAYSDRLGAAGVETVADLAAADAATLAEETGIAEGRIETWIDRAGEF
ncbi:MAG: DUF4332 domain-containing protein, partial [Haloarculaceae archaeon]